jgi:hypothetical protein
MASFNTVCSVTKSLFALRGSYSWNAYKNMCSSNESVSALVVKGTMYELEQMINLPVARLELAL